MERSCWLIRAGEESRLAPTFDVAATVVVGWGDIPGLGDLTGLSRDAVVAVLEREPASDADAGELLVFRDDVKTGDAVVAFGTPELDLLVGEVTGEYEYRAQPSDGDYAHVRTVRWYARTGRDGLPGAMDEPPADRQSIRPLTPSAEWLVLTDSLRATDAPPVKAPTKTAVAKAAAATKAAARKAAAAVPKPPAKLRSRGPVASVGGGVRPKGDSPVPATLCQGCGLQKAKSQFRAGSPWCVDCRDRRGED